MHPFSHFVERTTTCLRKKEKQELSRQKTNKNQYETNLFMHIAPYQKEIQEKHEFL